MPKVYVVQEDGKNFTDAKRFGDLVVLLPSMMQVLADATEAVEIMEKKLLNFSSDADHLLLIGDPILIGIACSIVAANTNGLYSVLKWDKQNHTYNSVTIDIGEIV